MTDNVEIVPPNFRFTDTSGNPLNAGTLEFYSAGTSDSLTVYSNTGLTTSLGSTVTLSSSGEPTSDGSTVVSVYTGTASYKVIVKDSTGATVGTFDNQRAGIDTSTFSSNTGFPLHPFKTKTGAYTVTVEDRGYIIDSDASGGDFTLTAPGVASAGNNFVWGVENTGSSGVVTVDGSGAETIDGATTALVTRQYQSRIFSGDGAEWHIVGGYDPPLTVLPQGRLTPTTATPVLSSSSTAGGTVYYTPFAGNVISIYNGTHMVPYEFSELTLTLAAADNASATAYDVFVFLNSGAVTVGTGPAWTNSGAGAGDRTASALTRVKGIYVNNAQITCSNNGTDYTVAANQGTYVGSVLMDTTAAEVTVHVGNASPGEKARRKANIWNAYNRQPVDLIVTATAGTWAYSTGTWRQSDNDGANQAQVFMGLAEEPTYIDFQTYVSALTNNTGRAGIGYNSTSTWSGTLGIAQQSDGADSSGNTIHAQHVAPPALGLNNINPLEHTGSTWNGYRYHRLTAKYRG